VYIKVKKKKQEKWFVMHYVNKIYEYSLRTKNNNELMSSHSILTGFKRTLFETTSLADDEPLDRYDVIIKFLSAEVIHE
jgi:hypothetical protein